MIKRLFFAVLAGVALAGGAAAQTTNIYENDGNVLVPPQVAPQIDALSFVNKGIFDINLALIPTQSGQIVSYFETSDTLNYTNRNIMSGSPGYRFDTFAGGQGGNGSRRMASSFVNTGSILVGLSTNTNVLNNFFGFLTTAQIIASATNLTNAGLMEVGADGFINLTGNNVNLARGSLKVETLAPTNTQQNGLFFSSLFANESFGVFDTYWGVGINTNGNGFFNLPNPFGMFEPVTTQVGQSFQQIVTTNATAYANFIPAGPSNNLFQVVFVVNSSPLVTTDVRFDNTFPQTFPVPVIHWQGIVTNRDTTTVTNDLYLSDDFGQFGFATGLFPSGFIGIPPFAISQTFAPFNFTFSPVFGGYSNLAPANIPFNPAFFATPARTNVYAIYGVNVSPLTSQLIPNLPGSTISNMPGRIQVTASNVLDLTRAIINGPNYLTFRSTNHYVGSSNAHIVSPYYDVNLASTNGSLAISNLVAPVAPHLFGSIGMWSDGYTNIIGGVTNVFNVLIVNSSLLPVSPVVIQNLQLKSTNIIISDVLNVTNTVLFDGVSLTTTTNDPTSPSPDGEINVVSPTIIWSGITPRLSFVTNFGGITTINSVFFAGSRQPPYFNTTFNEPYQTFINHGFVSVAGALVWANYFENSGTGSSSNSVLSTNSNGIFTNSGSINCFSGPFTLQSSNAIMSNGVIQAVSDMSLGSSTLIVSNHNLITGGQLTLNVTNLLTDTGTNSSNFWQAGFGINLPIRPAAGDLLGTTISNFAPANLERDNVWAGEERGTNVAGFLNNAAIGHLILDGGDGNSTFFFSGPDAQNALYVDLIELKNGATNRAPRFINGQTVQIYTAIDVAPGMTVYFADAMASGQDISEKLNGTLTDSGGLVIWVPTYAGFFSSTNITFPSGSTFAFNRALAMSSTIDSDGDGIPNANDPTPFFVPDSINLSVCITNTPANSTVVSWQTLAGSTNFLFSGTSISGPNWSTVTNFVSSASGLVKVTNNVQAGVQHYFKVRVDPHHP